jgi:drug/metabolite transporter (DMT)-like permease
VFSRTITVELVRTIVLTGFTLVAFASNSILCRLALGNGAIDAASFTIIRLVAGAAALVVLTASQGGSVVSGGSRWVSAVMLFLYAIAFSFAYVTLQTGTGALILFGAVQITMILMALASGATLLVVEWIGMVVAFAGLVYLVLPGVTAPSFGGFCLMAIAGSAWGVYTLKGKGSANPLADTARNFVRTLPFTAVVALFAVKTVHLSPSGVMLAAASGAIASGVGYTVWYMALRGLSATQAAVVQLFVPVIAALGGVVFMSEQISLRLVVAGVMTLGGILMVVLGRFYFLRWKGLA